MADARAGGVVGGAEPLHEPLNAAPVPEQRPCCLFFGKANDELWYTGDDGWTIPEVEPGVAAPISVCSVFGSTLVDFRNVHWGNLTEVKLNARCLMGDVTVVIPDDGVKVDTTCAGCFCGWVWCGGYLGDYSEPKTIVLCEYAFVGRVQVKTASQFEKRKRAYEEKQRRQQEQREVQQGGQNVGGDGSEGGEGGDDGPKNEGQGNQTAM